MAEGQEFFCEKCGAAVPGDAEKCPKCGRVFYSVRCPSCGFTGNADLFVSGCPLCGYRISGGEATPPVRKGKKQRRWLYRIFTVLLAAAIIYFIITYLRL